MKTTLAIAASLGLALASHAGKIPDWWSASTTSILVPGAAESNYAPLNLGQLKYTAFRAKAYLDTNLPGGAGSAVNALVAGFSTTGNLKPVTIGQLKAVAKPFYDRLIAVGYFTKINLIAHGYPSNWAYDYPWNNVTPVPVAENYRPANIGQLKVIFSFDVGDADSDGLPDSWESQMLTQSGGNGSWLSTLVGDGIHDADGDGISDLAAYRLGDNAALAPETPANLVLDQLQNGTASLTWSASRHAKAYSVKQALSFSGPYTTVQSGLMDTHASVTGLSANTNYYFVVTSTNDIGESANSMVVTNDITGKQIVYFAVRTDGQNGSGSQQDPYDGSYRNGVSNFDKNMRVATNLFAATPPAAGKQNEIRLAQGIYWTWGDNGNYAPDNYPESGSHRGFLLPANTRLVGAGMGRSILKVIGVDPWVPGGNPGGVEDHGGAWRVVVSTGAYTAKGYSQACDNVSVENLTVDCNTADFFRLLENGDPSVTGLNIGGVQMAGDNCIVRKVEVLRPYAVWPQETAGIRITAFEEDSFDFLVDSCKVDHYSIPQHRGGYVNGILATPGTSLDHRLTGVIQNCNVINSTWAAYNVSGPVALSINNTANNVNTGFYWDTASQKDDTYRLNTIICAPGSWSSVPVQMNSYSNRSQQDGFPALPLEVGNLQLFQNYLSCGGDGTDHPIQYQNHVFGLGRNWNTLTEQEKKDGITPDQITPLIEFNKIQVGNNTFAQNTYSNPIHGLIVVAEATDWFRNIQFIGGNVTSGNFFSPLWAPSSESSQNPDVTFDLPTYGTVPSVTITQGTSHTIQVGQNLQLNVSVNTPVTLRSPNLPASATTSPALPIVNLGAGVPMGFSWTPSLNQAGLHTISFIAQNGVNTGFGVATVNVVPNPSISTIVWKKLTSAEATDFPSGSSIERAKPGVAGGSWDAKGIGSSRLFSDGSISFRFSRTDRSAAMGLFRSSPNFTNNPGFAVVAKTNGTIDIVEAGVVVGSYGAFTPANVFTISRTNGQISYYKDATLLRGPISQGNSAPLLVEADFAYDGISVYDCVMKNGTPAEDVSWSSLVGMTGNIPLVDGNSTVTKTAPSATWDNAKALSSKRIVDDGFVSFQFGQTTKTIQMGLSSTSLNNDPLSVEYAIVAHPGGSPTVEILEAGVSRGSFSFTQSDVFKIARQGDVIKYYQNNTLRFTTAGANKWPLMAVCNAFDNGASVANCIYSGVSSIEAVQWQQPPQQPPISVNVTPSLPGAGATGSRLDKLSGGTGWNAEGVSTKRIPENADGFVQFQFGGVDKTVSMGLSARNRDLDGTSPQFAMVSKPGSNPKVEIVEFPVAQFPDKSFNLADNDIFKIARENGVINYYQNGVKIATSPKVESRSLMVECDIYDQFGYVKNCTYSGGIDYAPIEWVDGVGAHLVLDSASANRGAKVVKSSGSACSEDFAYTTKVMQGDGEVEFQFGSPQGSCPAETDPNRPDPQPIQVASVTLISTDPNSLLFFEAAMLYDKNNSNPYVEFRRSQNNTYAWLGYVGGHTSDMVFKFARRGGVLRAYVNNLEIPLKLRTESSSPLKFRCALKQVGSYVTNGNFSGFSNP